ncbi:unnamed protein product [Dicrocoelium dendriticum]|nr:unnamed protein product [Dicrocoelium dendriticum]
MASYAVNDVLKFIKDSVYSIYTLIYIFGGIVPYVPQYLEIRRLRSVKGFSTFVCLILLIANILRICFWFVQPFSAVILLQSVVMIVAMLVMMRLTASVLSLECQFVPSLLSHKPLSPALRRTLWGSPIRHFWQWTDFPSYILFILLFTFVASTITYMFSANAMFVGLLGFASLLTEALLGLPQLIKNHRNKSTKGMSVMMVALWTFGDICKSIFFMVEKTPIQFPFCGWLQVALDCAILGQHFFYARTSPSFDGAHFG